MPPPLSKIPENGRLRVKLRIYNECGLKLQKNLNQYHMNSWTCLSSTSLVAPFAVPFRCRDWQNGYNFLPDHGNAAKYSGNMQN